MFSTKMFAKKLIILLGFVSSSISYNILAVLPFQSKSHYATIDPLVMKLAERGHTITVYNPFPKKKLYANYREVDTSSCFTLPSEFNTIEIMSRNTVTGGWFMSRYPKSLEHMEQCTPLLSLLNTTENYDLLITECFATDVTLMFAKFQIPVITYIPMVMLPHVYERTANPMNPSYIPNMFSGYVPPMSFLQRAKNTLLNLIITSLKVKTAKIENHIVKHYLGSSASTLLEMVKNTSLILTSTHYSVSPVIPHVPQVVPIAGIHIQPAATLPKDIEKFLNESTHGVVYFCMGSLLQGKSFSAEKRDAFLEAFLKIPQRILWKWEGDELPGKSDKIMISKWMPQRDILAHPKVKLFISHGGLLSISEAVYEGMPVLGVPIFSDQRGNVKSLAANGAGELMEYKDISAELVFDKIQKIINNPTYKRNAVELSARFKDRPMSPLDTAVYWTEYVTRHKGAHHLKTAAVDMPWYQYLLLDVIAFLVFVLVIILIVLYHIIKFGLRLICGFLRVKKSTSSKNKGKKRN